LKEILIGPNEAGQRLDKLVIKFLPLAPKCFIYKMIRRKNITLNGRKCEGSEILTEGDDVRLWLADDTIMKFKGSKQTFRPASHIPDVIYEDADIVVFNKPAGMLSQKAGPQDISMNEVLISYLLDNGSITEKDMETFRPSICNRLDRNTSGLIICGKSLRGLQDTAVQLRERTAHKDYIAIVRGRLTEGRSLRSGLLKDRNNNIVTIGDAGEHIETDFKPLWTDGSRTVLMVRLVTGRTHQIRAHLASVGHPILGDPKYGDGRGAKRQLLHAYRLTLPDGRSFTAPLPEDMKWELGKPEAFEDLPWRI